jgi:hypothetical protein
MEGRGEVGASSESATLTAQRITDALWLGFWDCNTHFLKEYSALASGEPRYNLQRAQAGNQE